MLSSSSSPAPFQSPNAIPPRTSSTGYTVPHVPSKSVLRPVPESDWLGQSTRAKHRHNSSVTTGQIPASSSAIMQASAPSDTSRFETEDFNFAARKTWTDEKEKILWGPYDYLAAQAGKDFRKKLIAAFNTWLNVPEESIKIITKVVGMLHNSSLLVDDVEDNSLLRRGMPVAHSIFGTAQTINTANYMYFVALQEIQKLNNPKAISIYMDELLNLHRGQGMDLFWRDTLTVPTEEDYLEMVDNKTGGLFRLGIKLMQAESPSLLDCTELVNLLGLIFQIRDDYMNLDSDVYSKNKGMCEDLTEGKFSFLIIHSIRANPSNLQLINILKQKPTDEEVKRYAVKYMHETGSFAYTKKVLDVLIERARKVADKIDEERGKNEGIHLILDAMVIQDTENGTSA
ncbi:putative farnesyltranstransferase (al-3) [Apiospora arundinis]|uniref:Isoprenoid synthase domain-containing protein n=1 Tax=Apiospora arundinis TaxID=335852 RepID=A0ABR2J9L8_9PEZI